MKDKNIEKLACGYNHSIIWKKNGELIGIGENGCGQLGIGNSVNQKVPVQIMQIESLKDIQCGNNFSVFLTQEGELMGCGGSENQQLGQTGDKVLKPIVLMHQVSQVACGSAFTVVLKKNGEVLCTGMTNGKLFKQEQIIFEEEIIRLFDNELKCWTFENHSNFPLPFQKSVVTFLLCMKRNIPRHLKLPKPLLSIVLNHSLF